MEAKRQNTGKGMDEKSKENEQVRKKENEKET